MGRRIGLGIAGLGRMGRLYLEIAARYIGRDRLRIFVTCAHPAKAESIAREYGVEWFPSFEHMVRSPDVDAIVVATPSHLHAEMIARAAEEGKHVFVEKPIDVDPQRARRAIEVAERRGITLLVGHTRRFDQEFRRAKRLVESGAIGRPIVFIAVSRDPEPPPPGWLRDPEKSGGVVIDLGIHDIDTAMWILGEEISRVCAWGSREVYGGALHPRDFDTVTVAATTRSGKRVLMYWSRFSPYGYDIRCEVHGTEGSVFVGRLEGDSVRLCTARGIIAEGFSWFQRRFFDAYRRELEHFLNLVTGVEERLAVEPREALRDLIVARRVIDSIQLGRCLEVET